MDYASLLRGAQRGELPPVLLVYGADAQLLDDALASATLGLFSDPSAVLEGREVLDGREVDADVVVRVAMTLPLFTTTRLVAVRHAQVLGAKSRDALAAYAADPTPSTRLLLLADEPLRGMRDRGDHWLLAVVPPASTVEIPTRRGRAVEEWLKERAAGEGLKVSEPAARLLVQWVGEDGATLLGEARKAALAGTEPFEQVDVDEVTRVVGEHRVVAVFELTRAIERRDVGSALALLDRLLAGEEPMLLLSVLTREVRNAWTISEWHRQGKPVEQIARILRRPPASIEAVLASAAAASIAPSAKLGRCWEVERRLKSGGEARAELTALVADLCGARR